MYICDQFTEYHDNTLAEEIRTQVNSHLSICETCQKTFDELISLIQTMNKLPSLKTSSNFTSDLMQRINTSDAESAWHRVIGSTYFKVASYAVAAGLIVALGLNVWLDPVSPKLLPGPSQFTEQKSTGDQGESALAGAIDSASSKSADSLQIQQTIQGGGQSLQLVNSSK